MSDEIKFISIREFSRRLECSDTAVLKAIKAGKITEDCIDRTNPKRPKINPEMALKSWGKNYAPNWNQSAKIETAIQNPKPTVVPKKIVTAEDFDEDESDLFSGSEEIEESPTWVKKGANLNTAKTAEAIHKANLAQIEVLEAKKKLISRAKAERAFHEVGIIIRTKLQGLPDKIIDSLRVIDDRMEAHTFLYKSIAECLEDLSTLEL